MQYWYKHEYFKYCICKKFILAYNSMNIDKMLEFLHPEIIFQNISKGEITFETHGISEFKEIANQSLKLFKRKRAKNYFVF